MPKSEIAVGNIEGKAPRDVVRQSVTPQAFTDDMRYVPIYPACLWHYPLYLYCSINCTDLDFRLKFIQILA